MEKDHSSIKKVVKNLGYQIYPVSGSRPSASGARPPCYDDLNE